MVILGEIIRCAHNALAELAALMTMDQPAGHDQTLSASRFPVHLLNTISILMVIWIISKPYVYITYTQNQNENKYSQHCKRRKPTIAKYNVKR